MLAIPSSEGGEHVGGIACIGRFVFDERTGVVVAMPFHREIIRAECA